MWLSLTNRYERLRGKVFLREDLFQSSMRASTDASKLETRSVSLHWTTQDLYRLLIRHMAAMPKLQGWLSGARVPLFEKAPFGTFPPENLPEVGVISQKSFVEKLAGEIMGGGANKGYTHRWIPNHLQDTHGAIVPRSVLNIVAFAAEWALQNGSKAVYSRLLHPSELQAALEKTSQYRANELAEEHPVVKRMEHLRDQVLFAEYQLVERLLQKPGIGQDDGIGSNGNAALEELVRLGVIKVRDDKRIDVPDIYRSGFGIKRKGGVARPR
jgi:hypothetical protein